MVLNDSGREDAFFLSKTGLFEDENAPCNAPEIAFEKRVLENLDEFTRTPITRDYSRDSSSACDDSSCPGSFPSGRQSSLSSEQLPGFCGLKLGVAVSGGADSVSLLVSVASICRRFSMPLKVCTVNHRIRTNGDSEGDVLFVRRLCQKIRECGCNIELFEKQLGEGEVSALAKNRKCGEEEAARFLRYQAFEEFKTLYSLDFVLLAHNADDNLETILMRFLQGSFSSGIRPVRDFYVRPLITITRKEIEVYLNKKNIPWRTDMTNFNQEYFRNRVRSSLVPFLNQNFEGWGASVLNGAGRYRKDEEHFEAACTELPEPVFRSPEKIAYERNSVSALDDALLSRLFYESFNKLGILSRVPYRRIQEVLAAFRKNNAFEIVMKDVTFGFDLSTVYVKKTENVATESYFFAIIEETGVYNFPFGGLSVEKAAADGKCNLKSEYFRVENVSFPFVVRSVCNSDCIKASDGSERRAKSILSSWHIPAEKRSLVPVVIELKENKNIVRAILGSVLCDDKNWIVGAD